MTSIAISGAKRLAGELRRGVPRRLTCRNFDHRRHGKLPGQSANEQVAIDAMVSRRGAPISCLQVCCTVYNEVLRFRSWPPI